MSARGSFRLLWRAARPLAARSFSRAASFSKSPMFAAKVFAVGASVGIAGVALSDSDLYAKETVDKKAVQKEIEDLLDENDDMGPTLVRLAWHASGTYNVHTKTGGSEGATMRFSPESGWGANAGLAKARAFLEPIKAKFPDMSYADLWTFAGCVAIEHMGGPTIGWSSGRVDSTDGNACPPDGRLPDADKGSPTETIAHVRKIFGDMGFNDQQMVALIGAHALGRCHRANSGYEGPWTRAPTTFSNEFYRLLLEEPWTLRKGPGNPVWQNPDKDLIMLPADMALIWDADFRKWVEIYAKDSDRFFADFAQAFQILEENGVKAFEKKKGWW